MTVPGAGVRGRVRRSLAVLRPVVRNSALRRVQLGWAASMVAENTAAVALAVVAYRAGGAAAVGLVGVVQMVPNALTGPASAMLGDRFRRERVVAAADGLRAAVMLGTTAAVAAGAPLVAVLVLAAALSVVTGAFYPSQAALVPLLARTAEEVTAAAAVSSLLRSSASFAAPAAAGLALLVLPPGALFGAAAAAFATAALLVRGLPRTDALRTPPAMGSAWTALAQGIRSARQEPAARLALVVFTAQSATRGALGVLLVVVSVELLRTGSAGVGLLTACLGLGSFLGALGAAGLIGRRRLAGPMRFGLAVTAVPLLGAAAVTVAPVVVVAVTVTGAGLTFSNVTGTTLLVRSVRDDVLARVLGVLGTVRTGGTAVGAALTPVLLAWLDLRATLVVFGAALLVLLVAVRRWSRTVDATSTVPVRELALVRGTPVFAALPPVALERVAARLERLEVDAGTAVVDEGDEADCVYLVADGELVVEAAEAGGPVDRIGPGEVFGEMALLHDARRNATVRAVVACELYRLTREEFLAAVAGSPTSTASTADLVAARLEHRRRVVGAPPQDTP